MVFNFRLIVADYNTNIGAIPTPTYNKKHKIQTILITPKYKILPLSI